MDRKDSSHLELLDALKGLAIIGVLFVHFNNACGAPNQLLSVLNKFGCYSPQIFFVISAFLLCYTSHKYNSLKSFYRKKLKSILPVYVLALVLVIVSPFYTEKSLVSILAHLTFLNALIPQYINDIITVEWYMANLVLLILLYPFIARLINNYQRAFSAFIISLFLAFAIRMIGSKYQPQEDRYIYNYLTTFCFILQLPSIFIGFILYYLKTESVQRKKIISSIAILLLLTMVTLLLKFYGYTLISTGVFLALFATFPVIMYEGMIKRLCHSPFLNAPYKIFQSFGRESLGMYLFHMIVLWTILAVIEGEKLGATIYTWSIGFIALVAISYLFAKLITRVISKVSGGAG